MTVFGAIYANSLVANLSASAAAGSAQAYADALHNVFVGVLPVAALAFLLSWFLEEVPFRSTRVELDPGSGESTDDEQLRAA